MTILEKRKLAPERDEHLKNGEFTVLNGEYSKNFNVYVVGNKHKEAVDFIKVALDRSTDNVLGFGIKMGCQKNFNVIVWDEEDIPEDERIYSTIDYIDSTLYKQISSIDGVIPKK